MKNKAYMTHIEESADTPFGKPSIRGTRITDATIFVLPKFAAKLNQATIGAVLINV